MEKVQSIGDLIKATMCNEQPDVVPNTRTINDLIKEAEERRFSEFLEYRSDLYTERFIGAGSEFPGTDLDDNDLHSLVYELYQFKEDFELASWLASTDDDVYKNYIDIVQRRDYADYCSDSQHETVVPDELYDDLVRQVRESTVVCLVNYKGEMESLGLLETRKRFHRTFNSKYNYS